MSVPTAYAPVPALLTSLRRAGWGDLGTREFHGLRQVLDGLAALLPHGSGQGWVTAEQVAQASGYRPRWTRELLRELEGMGLIEWRRGGIVAGTPQPSWIRIVKTALVELILAARPLREAVDAARRAATRVRIAAARALRRPDRRLRRSAHAAVSASPPTPTGEDSRPTSSPEVRSTSATRLTAYVAATCEHDGEVGRCPMCRRQEAQAS